MTIGGDHGIEIRNRSNFGNIYLNDHNTTIMIRPGGGKVSLGNIVDNTHDNVQPNGNKTAFIIIQDDAPTTLAFTGHNISNVESIMINISKDKDGKVIDNYDHTVEFDNNGLFHGVIADVANRTQTTVKVKGSTTFTNLVGAYFYKGGVVNAPLLSFKVADESIAGIYSQSLNSLDVKLESLNSGLYLNSLRNDIAINAPIIVADSE